MVVTTELLPQFNFFDKERLYIMSKPNQRPGDRGQRSENSGQGLRTEGRSDGRVLTREEVLRRAASRPRKRKPKAQVSVAALLVAVVLAAVVAASVFVIVKFDRPQAGRADEIVSGLGITGSAGTETEPEGSGFVSLTRQGDDVHRGYLILVNYENEYVFPETEEHLVSVYTYKTPYYNVAYNNYLIDTEVINYFNGFMRDLYDKTGDTCILVNSTYRDLESQRKIYDDYVASSGEEYASKYVSNPGYSEHHTGLSLDLTIRYSDGSGQIMQNYENLDTLNAICADHGFVQRYGENKYEYTRINTEPWHYRYVGVPHARIMTDLDLCLEEYVEYVKDYTVYGEVLLVTEDGQVTPIDARTLPDAGHIVYYVHEAAEGDTEIPIPEGKAEYKVSGNNVDGFIVDVELGAGA